MRRPEQPRVGQNRNCEHRIGELEERQDIFQNELNKVVRQESESIVKEVHSESPNENQVQKNPEESIEK